MRILISGGGIAGLTLAILLKQNGFEPVVVEREPALRREGYMMDFFGTGWDVAERMNLVEALRAVHYPIERGEFIGPDGKPYCSFPIDRLRRALSDRYVYLRRPDLERILLERARDVGAAIEFNRSIDTLEERGSSVDARFADGARDEFGLVIGADGVHSNVREIVFGPERSFARELGYYAAAFHFPSAKYPVGHALKLYEETDHTAWLYPLNDERADATYMFRHPPLGHVPHAERLTLLRKQYRQAGWIAGQILHDVDPAEPIFFDSLTQIVMPEWHRGRVTLIGDACGCLTLAAGQGSQIAMGGAYVLARELARNNDHRVAFAAYQSFLKPHVAAKQRDAARFANLTVPSVNSHPALRRLAMRIMFSPAVLGLAMKFFGTQSILPKS
jgi:2-polyprenyl-6-methoxyphenol hydroxylase-like FAD-dependent oxidoreductase